MVDTRAISHYLREAWDEFGATLLVIATFVGAAAVLMALTTIGELAVGVIALLISMAIYIQRGAPH